MLHRNREHEAPLLSPTPLLGQFTIPAFRVRGLFTLLLAKWFLWMMSSSLLFPFCPLCLWDLRDTFDPHPHPPPNTQEHSLAGPASLVLPAPGKGCHAKHQVSSSPEPPGPPVCSW